MHELFLLKRQASYWNDQRVQHARMLCHHSILGPYQQSSSVCNSTTSTSVCHASLQVLCDLVCVYTACVRSAAAPPGVPGPVRCAPAHTPDAFATAVQVLRDTKHFVKDYGGGAPGAVLGSQAQGSNHLHPASCR